jgi:hypothetical protein
VAVTVWSAWAVGLAVWAPAAPLLAQEAPAEKCVFEGTARNSVTLLALGKVSIHLIPSNRAIGYAGSSKADGTFRFEGVVAGDYMLEAQRTGYSAQWVLSDKSGRAVSTLHLAPGKVFSGNDLWFTPEGAIEGQVMGPDGEPLPAASVTLIARQWRRGKRVYVGAGSETTGDTGAFRFSPVAAGRYLIYAGRPRQGPLAGSVLEAPGKPEMRVAGRYHPNAAQVDGAAAIELRPGEEISGIDFKLPFAPVFHLTGTAAQGEAAATGIDLKPRYDDQTLDWAAESASIGSDGKFDLEGVTPGTYFLSSFETSLHDRLVSAKLPVTVVSQDSAGVVAPPVARFELKGRVRVEGGGPPEKIPVQIFYEGSEADEYTSYQRRAEPQPDGTFAIRDLTPDRYTIRIANLDTGKEGGFYLKSVYVNGVEAAGREIDLTDGPVGDVELILSAAVGSAAGTVVWPEERGDNHAAPEPAAELTVVLIPEKVPSGDTRPVEAYLDQDGRFQVTDLEPGTYRAFAVTHYDLGLWQNAEFLRQVADRGVALEVAGKSGAPIEVPALRAADVRQVEERLE